jgi:hypothetical protein
MGNSRDDDDKKRAELKRLLADAHASGTLSRASHAVLDIPDVGAQIQAALGTSVDDVGASEVVLVTMMPDDSGSIAAARNTAAVRDGHNLVLDALAASRQAADVLVHTRYLNGHILTPYVPLAQAVRMDACNYDPSLGTPLFDQAVVLLGTVLAKAEEFTRAGVAVRTVTLLITDGGDAGSRTHRAADVRALVADLTQHEHHIVAGLGLSDGSTDFRKVFGAMGIPDRWILTPGGSASEIRRAFAVFSKSATSLGGAGVALGGFAN